MGDDFAKYLRKFARPNYKKSVFSCHKSKDILPATGKSWRYARINGHFYYDYDFIPDREGTKYRSRLGDKDTLLLQYDESMQEAKEKTQKEIGKEIEEYVLDRMDNRDITTFMYHTIGGVCKYNWSKAHQLAEAMAWAKSITRLVTTDKYKDFGIDTQAEFYDICASVLSKKNLEGLSVSTGGSLRKKLHYFPENEDDRYEFFVSKRYGNDNARKLGKEKLVNTETGEIYKIDIHQALILDLWMNPGGSGKGSKKELWEQYKDDLHYLYPDIEPISYTTFCHYTDSYEIRFKTAKERHGEAYFNRVYLPYISSKKPVYANSLWCADGSSTIAYRYTDEKGKLNSMRLYVMMVSDVATGKIVGWCPSAKGMHNETHQMVRNAVLMGLRENGKHEVMEFVSDNHGAFTSDESKSFLKSVCRVVRNIKPGNSQANYAETQFRLFKKRLYRLPNWLGSSWDAKSIEHKANEDYINPEDFPTYDEAIIQLGQKIDEWNSMKTRTGVSRSELYAENIHPEAGEIDPIAWRRLSGTFSMREITRQRGTITLEKNRVKYKFEVPDYEVLGDNVKEYLGYTNLVQTQIYWDDECADVYTEDGCYMFTCYKALEATIDHIEADDDSMTAIGKGMIKKAHANKAISDFTEEVTTVSGSLYSQMPEGYNVACKIYKKVKETTNGERETALAAKARQKRKEAAIPDAIEAERGKAYMEKRKQLYK